MKPAMHRRRILFPLGAIVGVLLAVTAVIDVGTSFCYQRELLRSFHVLGKKTFGEPDQVAAFLRDDPGLNGYRKVLEYTPPLGWMAKLRLDRIDEKVLFMSRNYGLPEAQRFADPAECRAYGFDPEKKGDDEIVEQTLEVVRP